MLKQKNNYLLTFCYLKKGCLCEDCSEGSDDGDYEFGIKALLDNAYNDKNGSIDDEYFLDDRLL